jgi:hypothetical protein
VTEHPVSLEDCVTLSGKAFAEAVLRSDEFRLYITEGLNERTLPPAVLCRLIDHGWGKPPDRVELTGKDGEPVKTITRIVSVIVDPAPATESEHATESVH